jgi:hypothetical protein
VGFGTLLAAVAAARYARDAARETRRSATAAENAITQSGLLGEAQTRAYISITECTLLISEDHILSLSFSVFNSGSSPALSLSSMFSIEVRHPDGSTWEYANELTGRMRNYEIPSQHTVKMPRLGSPDALSTDAVECLNSDRPVTVTGNIVLNWKDVFGKLHSGYFEFTRIGDSWPINEAVELQKPQEMYAKLINEIARRRSRGEWSDDQ